MAPVDLVGSKIEVRKALLTARRSRPESTLRNADARLWRHLSDLVRVTRPSVVAAYEPFGTEPGAHLSGPLPRLLARHAAVRVLVPVLLADNDLDWRDWDDDDLLGEAEIAAADLVIAPALAVDTTGVRLGRGGGSYDRALARVAPDVPIVALVHDGEFAHSLPAQPHDRRVTAVITPTAGMIRLPQ
nr:5-formyltetrahydrofolate cyclo-ligase [Hamadaea tsunoensis]